MLRPFKDIKEFNTEIRKSIGSIIKLRYKANPKQIIIGMITSFGPDVDAIGIGSCVRYLNDMSNVYEYFDEDSAKWLPFGIEEEEPKEQVKPRKFKVGKRYCFLPSVGRGYPVLINAKYRDPEDNKVKVVVNGTTFSTVYTNKDGDERVIFFNEEIKAENEIKEVTSLLKKF